MVKPVVFRFDEVDFYRSHVVARSRERAIAIFERTMGPIEWDEMEVYPIDGSTLLPISESGQPPFVEKTADEWIEHDPSERFL